MQGMVALSTVKSEFISMCHVLKEVILVNNFLVEIKAEEFVSRPTIVNCDNQEAIIALSSKQIMSERCKHIRLQHFFLRDMVEQEIINFVYIRSQENPAEIFTKPVRPVVLNLYCAKCGLSA